MHNESPAKVRAPEPARRLVRLPGATIATADDYPTFWDRAEAGLWEPGTLAVLPTLLAPDAIFLDLGAWIGPTSLYAAAHGARVIAVEADPAALAALKRNIAANPHLAARITVVERAVSARAEPVSFGARRKPGDSMSSALLAEGAATTWTTEAVTPTELAAMIAPDQRPVIKIDIEGGEYALLPALGPLLTHPATAALVSFHPRILGEARPQADLAALSHAALAPFAGWSARRIEDHGAGEPQDIAALTTSGHPDGEWLFTKG